MHELIGVQTLFHTTGIFAQFAVLDQFPPQTIARVPEAVEQLEALKVPPTFCTRRHSTNCTCRKNILL